MVTGYCVLRRWGHSITRHGFLEDELRLQETAVKKRIITTPTACPRNSVLSLWRRSRISEQRALKERLFHVTLEPAEDGSIVAECPVLPGCVQECQMKKKRQTTSKKPSPAGCGLKTTKRFLIDLKAAGNKTSSHGGMDDRSHPAGRYLIG